MKYIGRDCKQPDILAGKELEDRIEWAILLAKLGVIPSKLIDDVLKKD